MTIFLLKSDSLDTTMLNCHVMEANKSDHCPILRDHMGRLVL
jgi:hypothetical protein